MTIRIINETTQKKMPSINFSHATEVKANEKLLTVDVEINSLHKPPALPEVADFPEVLEVLKANGVE